MTGSNLSSAIGAGWSWIGWGADMETMLDLVRAAAGRAPSGGAR
jgi:hypothetical protein